ncbi:hypothetical protein H1P_170004 [Hyella patelloides LEGE 07179]|uniref:Uncharacterized protein n=1 Tax=Hyella patelloides LEGE 07179 TaxID=945734 RepID=A0A563VN70_9CYAN|nr:hypothetical protein H1P_170004 [Hyella patelloides LEGE 07179]
MMILAIAEANFSPVQLIGVIAVICVMQIILELNYAITSS